MADDLTLNPNTGRPYEPAAAPAPPGKLITDPAVNKQLDDLQSKSPDVAGTAGTSAPTSPDGWSALNAVKAARDFSTDLLKRAVSQMPQNPIGTQSPLMMGLSALKGQDDPKVKFMNTMNDQVSGELARSIVPQTAGDIPRTAAMLVSGTGPAAMIGRVGLTATGGLIDYYNGQGNPLLNAVGLAVHAGGEVLSGVARRLMTTKIAGDQALLDMVGPDGIVKAIAGKDGMLAPLGIKDAAEAQNLGQGGEVFERLVQAYVKGIQGIKDTIRLTPRHNLEIKSPEVSALMGQAGQNTGFDIPEVMDTVVKLGKTAFTKSPSADVKWMGQTLERGQARDLYKEVQDQLVNQLDQHSPDLGTKYQTVRTMYDHGLDVSRLFSDINVFKRPGDNVQLDMKVIGNGGTLLQQHALEMLGDFQRGSPEKVKAGQQLLQSIYRGGTIGGGDFMTPDPLSSMYLRMRHGAVGAGESTGLGARRTYVGKAKAEPSPATASVPPAAVSRGLSSLAPQENTAQ